MKKHKEQKTKKLKAGKEKAAVKVEVFDSSRLIEEIGKLTVKIQGMQKDIEQLKDFIAMKNGHIAEKENKLNMIRSILGKND